MGTHNKKLIYFKYVYIRRISRCSSSKRFNCNGTSCNAVSISSPVIDQHIHDDRCLQICIGGKTLGRRSVPEGANVSLLICVFP